MTERCGCEIHEEIHHELPDQPVEYIVLRACPLHEYDVRGLQTTVPEVRTREESKE